MKDIGAKDIEAILLIEILPGMTFEFEGDTETRIKIYGRPSQCLKTFNSLHNEV